ncbi:hypothetical protein ACHAXR_012732 [Thalassiosira sp. AJA248-18]
MPTFRQINVHPQTQERLSGLKRKHTSSDGNDLHEDAPAGSQHPSASAATSASLAFAAIRTPSALLSRDPTQLSTALGAPLENIKEIRASVAEGIIYDPHVGHGGHAAELVAGVTNHCVDDVTSIGDDFDGNGDSKDELRPRLLRPPALMAGSVTALDLCARTLLLENIFSQDNNASGSSHLGSIGTGSSAIDQLLSPGNLYSSIGDLRLPFPYRIPAVIQPINDENIDNYSSGGGVPFGMVTEFSGPPSSGKTQLALSIAAHAAIENQLQVHYISGGNSRSALSRRLFKMCLELARPTAVQSGDLVSGGRSTNRAEEEAKSVALKALDRVIISSVPDAYSLLATLARIDTEEVSCRGEDNSASNGVNNGTLLIVDSVSGCLGHHLSGDKIGAALVSQVALTLRQMARTHDGHLGYSTTNQGQKSPGVFQPRRFAVVVTNGSVAKRTIENNEFIGSGTTARKPTANKPAMGRYWHVSDVGIWLEEDKSQRDGQTQPINFYDDTSIVGLSLAENKVVSATLQNHYGKSCKSGRGQTTPKFRIRSSGIADV